MKNIYLLLSIVYFSFLSAGGDEKVDGEYIMHHIQDDRVFELFNP